MKSVKEMEGAVDVLAAYILTGLVVILVICIAWYVVQLLVGLFVAMCLGGV